MLCVSILSNAQNPVNSNDTIVVDKNSPILTQDSINIAPQDTIIKKKRKKVLDTPVEYKGDSMTFVMEGVKFLNLFGNAEIKYDDIILKAGYIRFNLDSNTVFADGITDSMGFVTEQPVFLDKDETFVADNLLYNLKTKKGIVHGIIREEGEGYLHSEITKLHDNREIHLKNGKYTTCDLEHPHFYIAMTKAKAIPNKRIISGPLYLVVADIPFYFIGLPFGYFPNQTSRTSGLLIPTYGEESNRGFYLRDGGWYFKINDYFDLTLRGSIYSQGSWSLSGASSYKKLYKFNGSVNVQYNKNVVGEKETPEYATSNDYSIRWNHSQDPKARPNSTFSANVNYQSGNYRKYNAQSNTERLSTQVNSSVSYTKRFPTLPFNFSANMRASQNTQTKMVNLTAPSASFSMDRQFVADWFRGGKKASGKQRLWDKLSISLNANTEYRRNGEDSIIFTDKVKGKNGLKYDIPISLPIKFTPKFLKAFTFSPSFNYTGRIYTKRTVKYWVDEYLDPLTDEINDEGREEEVEIDSLSHLYSFTMGASLSFNPRLYGMYSFRKPESHNLKAIRHVVTPVVSLNYRPRMGRNVSGDSAIYYNRENEEISYLKYQNTLYGLPQASQPSAGLTFSLGNNLEMKIIDKNDTAGATKKVKLLDRLNFSTSCNLLELKNGTKDEYQYKPQWSAISMNGSTRIFRNLLSVNFRTSFEPYTVDEDGNLTEDLELIENNKIGRLTSASLDLSMSLNPESFKKQSEVSYIPPPLEMLYDPFAYTYLDFNVPWNLSLRYGVKYNQDNSSFNIEKQAFDFKTTQTLSFSGGFQPTSKWAVNFSSGYDFEGKKLTYTSASITRDLHCWQMSFNWIPIGNYKSYNFQINVKSNIFKDIKYKKERPHYDNFEW